jgi:hypothetical protein
MLAIILIIAAVFLYRGNSRLAVGSKFTLPDAARMTTGHIWMGAGAGSLVVQFAGGFFGLDLVLAGGLSFLLLVGGAVAGIVYARAHRVPVV